MKKLALLLPLLLVSCGVDPVLDQRADDQGNEISGIPQGPFHRAGQRCTACHDPLGEASGSVFTLAGTVFAQPARQVGVDSAEVRLTDADGTKYIAKTNCVGNFFVKESEWNPKFPVLVEVAKGGARQAMKTPIGRERSCAGCHRVNISNPLAQVPHIYLFSTDELGAPNGSSGCAVDPRRPGSP